jgi:flagellar hook-associated protein 3 FlgL
MSINFARLGSANTYDNALGNLSDRQAGLSTLQEKLTAGKRVVRASDDPTAAAQAERALNRISRIASDLRALESQRSTITIAESTLGDVTNTLQEFRELVVSAGNGSQTPADRATIAGQLSGLRDQIFTLANRKDTNGQPLFSALGSALAPFTGPKTLPLDYTFNGQAGQAASGEFSIPSALDGESAFMLQPARDGAYDVTTSAIPAGRQFTPGPVTITDASQVSNNKYTITITNVALGATPGSGVATYDITGYDITTGLPSGFTSTGNTTAEFSSTLPVTVPLTGAPGLGLSMTLTGDPRPGDSITLTPAPSIFSVLDTAIRNIGGAANGVDAARAVAQALSNIDIGMGRVSAIRGQAGDLLNRADSINTDQDKRAIQMEADRSRAEDMDMVKGISEFQNQQTGYQAALQSYAQIQKLSLFNYLG